MRLKMKLKLAALSLALIMAGCASNPNKIQTVYVSPIQYKNYDCDQINEELTRVTRKANDLYASLKQDSDNDAAQMAIGLILFWPALFLLEGGDGPEAADYARLKGERDALEQIASQKKCNVNVQPAPSTQTD